ncbi:hypothetical protein VTP01DRAFT_9928 [Rhizomucor pusillus]|uniref:uncharacterized protein n=1 Tax=Rhizomucor pusillus TaxID=4840 RepID=UPI0037428B44
MKSSINMGYDTSGLTVSRKEAERLEKENAERLKSQRKLSLILDLDQTVVHATWDPTVGEWMKDESNANHPATKDIRQFTLPGNSPVYYIKLRPGLSEFIKEISELYELHIYTMGTRHYAEAVAREIDPQNNVFRGRILSRDESGSVTQKKIQRLFPCDTSMVVVLDDRSDVWSFSPNLIKIKPYEFFVGIGDINSPFAPKQPIPEPAPKRPPAKEEPNKKGKERAQVSEEERAEEDTDEEKENELDEKTILAQQQLIQDAMAQQQQEQRPLAKRQDELAPAHDQPLLVDDDRELYTMTKILKEVHRLFYERLEQHEQQKGGAGSSSEKGSPPDVKDLIPEMKKQVLKGVRIVFTGLIPQQQAPASSMYWQLAESFGAECLPELTGQVTHVIAARAGTEKVNRAKRISSIHIVTADWLFDSTARWERQDESRYMLLRPDAGESEVDNPESTPLDLDDGAFGSEEHGLFEDIDWDEADREVDDAINESGTDFGDTDSEAYNSSSSQVSRRAKRKRSEEGESSSEDDNSDYEARSPLAKRRLTAAQRGPSHLSEVTTIQNVNYPDDTSSQESDVYNLGDTWDDEGNQQEEQYKESASEGEERDYDEDKDDEEEDEDTSSLDEFAGELDGFID